ncbi:hypothetical protein BCV69DRAFT_310881 [Microstroma glucosiphilum]|uniref:Uncharacterized protein n=1 Tax=Pseudomicrostroma glucosiphilum TaxID=1684307 RepID=A0A316UET9_9BASI|nr:hypothetical protein BCV69DRAFT_310881 [Pseudomicrostroma glucosiphilum]PWN23424.1 hypothetical protein BCV69DRAFT_310881 [Pseudomicrostroma glucosiphilum]
MPSKRPVEQGDDAITASASTVKTEIKAESALVKHKSTPSMSALQRSGSESPSKKARSQQAFTKEEDEIIINHLLRDRDVRGIKKLLPNRRDSSLRCRVDYLTKKMKTCAGT